MRRSIVISVLTATTLLLAGCQDEGGSSVAPESPTAGTSNSKDAADKKDNKSTEGSEAAKSESASESATAEETSEKEKVEIAADGVRIVDPAGFTPPDPGGENSRIFVLQDGVTECFMNDVSGDSYMACRTNMVNPPMVQDYYGTEIPANAVSWNPSGVTYETMQFPAKYPSKTLAPGERLESFGFSCTASGPATVACSGPTGSATIDNGNVSGAKVPPKKEKTVAPAPAPENQGPALPEMRLPKPEDIFNGLPGQN